MKNTTICFLLLAASATAADLPKVGLIQPSVQFRLGYDSNPVGSSGTSAAIWGDSDTLTYAAKIDTGYQWSDTSAAKPALKLTYTGEAMRFDQWSSENYSTHRFGLTGQVSAGGWKLTGDGSSLYVAGSRDTLISVGSINANAVPLPRERRRQWQHRLKLRAETEYGAMLVRATGSLLHYDYQTNVVAGRVAYADRADYQAGLDLGWRQSADSLWLVGVHPGHQTQATVPLPNSAFEYSSNYQRLGAGWEGKLFGNTTLTLMVGPDFRHYSGAIDPRVMTDRDRTDLWFEGGFTTKLTPTLTLTGKFARMDWLSSTGKSAYIDTSAETAATLKLSSVWSLRLTAKVHRCDYFPAVRDDWESLIGAGVSAKLTDRMDVSLDVLRHQAWNHLPAMTEREFQRNVLTLGIAIKL